MSEPGPILNHLMQLEPMTLTWGAGENAPEVIAAIDPLELEYAALRKSAVLMDEPNRRVIEVHGADRLSFLDRMLTQKISDMVPGMARDSFWIDRKGRVISDLRVGVLDDCVLLDVDVTCLESTLESLDSFILMDEVDLRGGSKAWHRFAVHGPRAAEFVSQGAAGSLELEAGEVKRVVIAGHEVVVDRCDRAGELGIEIYAPAAKVVEVWEAISQSGQYGSNELRPVGWHAFNVARVESGTVMLPLDFGPGALPAETGLLESRVSFNKGCYPGQEIVARMQSRGHPKQRIVGLKVRSGTDNSDWQPVSGCPVYFEGEQVGAVTSSAISPMLGGEPICLASVRWECVDQGTELELRDAGQRVECVVQKGLRFWPRTSR